MSPLMMAVLFLDLFPLGVSTGGGALLTAAIGAADVDWGMCLAGATGGMALAASSPPTGTFTFSVTPVPADHRAEYR